MAKGKIHCIGRTKRTLHLRYSNFFAIFIYIVQILAINTRAPSYWESNKQNNKSFTIDTVFHLHFNCLVPNIIQTQTVSSKTDEDPLGRKISMYFVILSFIPFSIYFSQSIITISKLVEVNMKL